MVGLIGCRGVIDNNSARLLVPPETGTSFKRRIHFAP